MRTGNLLFIIHVFYCCMLLDLLIYTKCKETSNPIKGISSLELKVNK